MNLLSKPSAYLLAFSAVVSCLSAEDTFSDEAFFEEELEDVVEIYDPIEPVNRVIFKFNDFFVMNVMKPVSKGYTAVTTKTIRQGAHNVFYNLRYPVRVSGNLLQWRFDGAWRETRRFALNSTAGLAGVLDLASETEGLEKIPNEDVAQAFAAWGIPNGPYLVIPFIGPTTARDGLGLIGDAAVHPFTEPFTVIDDWEWRMAYVASDVVAHSEALINGYENMKGSAVDPYSSVKNGYFQFRRSQVED